MKQIFLITMIGILCFEAFSQGFNNIWELGQFTTFSEIDFTGGIATVSASNRTMAFTATDASICDSSGQLLFYSNGIYIANRNHTVMQNGGNLNPGQCTSDYSSMGIVFFQGNLIVPYPDSFDIYLLIHSTCDYTSPNALPSKIYYSKIDMTLDAGLGGVTEKNLVILNSVIDGGLRACKHANGRDWWVLTHKYMTDITFKILITAAGVAQIDSQAMGGLVRRYDQGSAFSPDGSWYATSDNLSKTRIYNFDRCTGTLSNFLYDGFLPDSVNAAGVSFSPNSKMLYITNFNYAYQYDLTATNIIASRRLVEVNDFYSSWAYHMLGTDGKIYVSSVGGIHNEDLGVIYSPDLPDTLCDFRQHSFHLMGTNNGALPNQVNYELGALIGSGCDTILKVNHSIADNIKFLITPNPVSDNTLRIQYNLSAGKEGQLTLFDISGKAIKVFTLPMWSTVQPINISNLSAGIYAAKFSTGEISVVRKFVKQ